MNPDTLLQEHFAVICGIIVAGFLSLQPSVFRTLTHQLSIAPYSNMFCKQIQKGSVTNKYMYMYSVKASKWLSQQFTANYMYTHKYITVHCKFHTCSIAKHTKHNINQDIFLLFRNIFVAVQKYKNWAHEILSSRIFNNLHVP